MNAKSSTAPGSKSDVKTSPFVQISDLENEQERRVQEALASLAAEESEIVLSSEASTKNAEEKFREEAMQDLREFAKKEPALILQKSEEETTASLADISKIYDKNGQKIVTDLVGSVTDLSVLTI